MDNKEIANLRKNFIVSESDNRMKSLNRNEYEDDEGKELKHPTEQKKELVNPKEDLTVKYPRLLRLFGMVNVVLLLFMIVLGAFVCHVMNGPEVIISHPLLLSLFMKFREYKLDDTVKLVFNRWAQLPEESRVKFTRMLTYSTVALNLYPLFSGIMKSANKDQTENAIIPESSTQATDVLIPLARFISGLAVCSFIGYDFVYNSKAIKALMANLRFS